MKRPPRKTLPLVGFDVRYEQLLLTVKIRRIIFRKNYYLLSIQSMSILPELSVRVKRFWLMIWVFRVFSCPAVLEEERFEV